MVTRDRCHLDFELEGGNLATHVRVCRGVTSATAKRIKSDIGFEPQKIVEVGASVGFKCIALAELFPDAEVIGIEPDREAVAVGNSMLLDFCVPNAVLIEGCGEKIEIESGVVDLVVCHTVIEHVANVDKCITEMGRILRRGGVLHMEAPNYLWPYEVHTKIFFVPLAGKRIMKLLGRLQVSGRRVQYLDNLQLVTPYWLSKSLDVNGFCVTNRTEDKVLRIARGEINEVCKYKLLARIIHQLKDLRVMQALIRLALTIGLYPSILVTAEKVSDKISD